MQARAAPLRSAALSCRPALHAAPRPAVQGQAGPGNGKQVIMQRPKVLRGEVMSAKMDRTCVVVIRRFHMYQPKYGKKEKVSKRFHVHDPENRAKEGDLVTIQPIQRASKKKTMQLVDITQKAVQL